MNLPFQMSQEDQKALGELLSPGNLYLDELPQVVGRTLGQSNQHFENRCRFYLKLEQDKLNADTALIALLCDAVRLAREYSDNQTTGAWQWKEKPATPTTDTSKL
jgi:hypothetical protein